MDRNELEALVEETLLLAKRLRQQKRHDEASEMLVGVLGHGIHADRIFFQLGNVYFDAGDLPRAEYSYRRATEVNPNYASAHHNLGVLYKHQNKISESIKAQRKAMMLELRGVKSPTEPRLSPEAAAWARKVSYQGMVALAVVMAIIIVIVYSL